MSLNQKIYIIDYIDYTVNSVESLVIEAESMQEAQKKAIEELKALHIPKRYLLKVEQVI